MPVAVHEAEAVGTHRAGLRAVRIDGVVAELDAPAAADGLTELRDVLAARVGLGTTQREEVLLPHRGAQRLGQLAVDGELGQRGLEVAAEVVVDHAQRALQDREEHRVLGLELGLAQEVAARIDHVAGAPEGVAGDVLDVDADRAQVRLVAVEALLDGVRARVVVVADHPSADVAERHGHA